LSKAFFNKDEENALASFNLAHAPGILSKGLDLSIQCRYLLITSCISFRRWHERFPVSISKHTHLSWRHISA